MPTKHGYQIQRAAIDAASSGDNTLVAAVSGQKIRIVSMFLIASGTVTVTLEDGAGGSALSGPIDLTSQTGFVLPESEHGWMETSAGTLLNLSLSDAIQVSGSLTYFLT